MDRALNTMGNEGPRPGDFSVCINCGQLLRFGAGLTLERLTNFDGLSAELVDTLLRTRRAVLAAEKTQ